MASDRSPQTIETFSACAFELFLVETELLQLRGESLPEDLVLCGCVLLARIAPRSRPARDASAAETWTTTFASARAHLGETGARHRAPGMRPFELEAEEPAALDLG